MRECVRVCVCACVRVCVGGWVRSRVRVGACVRVCVLLTNCGCMSSGREVGELYRIIKYAPAKIAGSDSFFCIPAPSSMVPIAASPTHW